MAAEKKPAVYSVSFEALAGPLDERGLVPLERARALVGSASAFVRGGSPPPDLLWAALLSLEGVAEFTEHALRLRWEFPFLRGWDNEDAVLRYGAGALPWLEGLLDQRGGAVGAMPAAAFYFVGTHLLAIGPEAAAAVLRVRRDGDPEGRAFLGAWLARHGTPAWVALGERAVAGDEAARSALGALAADAPGRVTKQLGAALAARLGIGPEPLRAAAILARLDEAARTPVGARLPWPTMVCAAGHFEYHALRVAAVRAPDADDWGILVEVVQGDLLGTEEEHRWPATVQRYTYGSEVTAGGVYLEDARPIPAFVAAEPIDDARVAELDLRPGCSITGDVARWPDVLRLRAAVAREPAALFTPAAEIPALLGVPGGEVLIDVRALEHVDGLAHGQGSLARLPSGSPAWRSLAEVIASRRASAFDPGTPNTDWREHAVRDPSPQG
jgi:hypothetical protein